MTNSEPQMSQPNRDFTEILDQEAEARRLLTLTNLGLLETSSIPVFEEATQMATYLLEAPICTFGIVDQDHEHFKSAVGLVRMGLMNDLASSRQLPRQDSFAAHLLDYVQVLAIADTTLHSTFSNNILVKKYGVRSYLGVPLLASNGDCLGALAVLDLVPRYFGDRDIASLQMIARWSLSEYERNYSQKQVKSASPCFSSASSMMNHSSGATVRLNLMSQMSQEMRTPLTSILGMTSVLNREIYGPLTDKQKEYMDIIHHSGQYLLSVVNEILELGSLEQSSHDLNLSQVDVEMLCQQALHTLQKAAVRREQQIRLTVEPGPRIWPLDKEKVRQMLYHILFSMIQAASSESTIRVHVSRKMNQLNISLWTSHPWLGEGLPPGMVNTNSWSTESNSFHLDGWDEDEPMPNVQSPTVILAESSNPSTPPNIAAQARLNSRQSLGLQLSQQLAELHGGNISLQGSAEAGYRYVIHLPHDNESRRNLDFADSPLY